MGVTDQGFTKITVESELSFCLQNAVNTSGSSYRIPECFSMESSSDADFCEIVAPTI